MLINFIFLNTNYNNITFFLYKKSYINYYNVDMCITFINNKLTVYSHITN